LTSQLDLSLPSSAQWTWSWTPAQYEHKAFQYFAPKAMLAVPVSSFAEWYDSTTWRWQYTSRLDLISVDPANGLKLYGSVDHSAFYNSDPYRYWTYTDIQRAIFMGDYIYAISDRGITVHRLADLAFMTAQPLPGYLPNNWWWWW